MLATAAQLLHGIGISCLDAQAQGMRCCSPAVHNDTKHRCPEDEHTKLRAAQIEREHCSPNADHITMGWLCNRPDLQCIKSCTRENHKASSLPTVVAVMNGQNGHLLEGGFGGRCWCYSGRPPGGCTGCGLWAAGGGCSTPPEA